MHRIIALELLLVALLAQASPAASPLVYYDFNTNSFVNQGTASVTITTTGTPQAGWTGGTVSVSDGTSFRPNGVYGGALNLIDVEEDQINLTNAGTSMFGNSFTISSWHYLSPNSSNASARFFVFEAIDNFDVSYGTLSAGSGSPPTTDLYDSYNASVKLTASPVNANSLTRNAWHHVLHSFTVSGANTTLTAYIDGVNVGTLTQPTANMNFSGMVLGNARTGAGDRQWDGLIDEFAVWSSGLNAADAQQAYFRGVINQPLEGVSLADGTVDKTIGMNIAATGWAGATQTAVAGANNDLNDMGMTGQFMRTTGAGVNSLTITYSDLDPHSHVNLGMLLAQLDSLDPDRDGERFTVRVDGQTIFDAGFGYGTAVDNSDSDPIVMTGNAALDVELAALQVGSSANLFGNANFFDRVYDLDNLSLFQMIPHTGSTLVLEIIGRQNQDAGNESFAVDNINLELVVAPEPSSLAAFGVVLAVVGGAYTVRRQRAGR